MSDQIENEGRTLTARERVLEAAEKCFMARGYAAVTLRDIAGAVGIKHTSLYHHVPGGKEELFVEVVERSLERHRRGLRESVQTATPDFRSRLHAVADWFLGQEPMDLVRMTQSDMPSLSDQASERLIQLIYESVLLPVEAILHDAYRDGETENQDLGLISGGLVGMIQSLFSVPESKVSMSRNEMGRRLIDAFLDGIATTPSVPAATSRAGSRASR
ncbi:MAG: TetR/AcrR family transcriptional regulator [Spirochaetota bacterium]